MKTKVAVIGTGSMGRNHARVYWEMPEVDFVGIADADFEKATVLGKKYGIPVYKDFREMLDKQKPDAVTCAVPTILHHEVALEVIDRGIHLLLEKPISMAVAEGEEIIQKAEKKNIKLQIGHIERFNPAIITLQQEIEKKVLGKIYALESHRVGPFPARINDVGVIIDLAVHELDIMRHIGQSEFTRVFAETERRIHTAHEDILSATLRMENGVIGTISINWLTPTKIRELIVIGDLGMFKVDYLTQDLYFFENSSAKGSEWEAFQILRGVSEGKVIKYSFNKKEPLRAEQEAFIAAVNGIQPVAVSGLDGLKALILAQKMIESGQTHQSVSCE
jgi:UDP-N-acetylglucosamine 3-dehydrogenase